MQTPLCILAEKHLTDKGPKFHGYTKHYYETICKFFDLSQVQKLGEIGIGNIDCMCHVSLDYKPGASLRMWKDFFPAAQIYGFDIVESTLIDEERISCKKMDQASIESIDSVLEECGSNFDIIVDDGSHIIQHQINTKLHAGKFLKPGGLLIIEDIEERYLDYCFGTPPEGFEMVNISEEDPFNGFVIYRRSIM